MKLKGKTALVTGASRGIGWEVALAFAREGADVAISARTEEPLLRLVEQITALQPRYWSGMWVTKPMSCAS